MRLGERFERLVALMARLRGPDGCPWDRQQTLDSLRPFILEEAYELVDAIDAGDGDAIREELGDLLLEILFVAQIATEEGRFAIDAVLAGLEDKMVRRHPHVFGAESAETSDEALARWEAIKAAEKKKTASRPASLLDGAPRGVSALLRARKLSDRAARVGFDWKSVDDVRAKLGEELDELDRARASGDREAVVEEIGDLLFVMANLARRLGIDPELALHAANRKFAARFRHIEDRLAAEGRSLEESSPEEMEALWQEAKARGDDAP